MRNGRPAALCSIAENSPKNSAVASENGFEAKTAKAEIGAEKIEGDKATILELSVADADVGKVIGKHGRIAKAMRTLLAAASTRSGKRVTLEILD